jgi:Na+-transporting methylmalonyl-CoA/oxaloacetate decarboxylase gamma subunit
MASTRPRPRRSTKGVATAPPVPAAPPARPGIPIGIGPGAAEPLARPLSLPGVTVEGALYALVLLASLVLRFWRLDDLPLSPMETRTALAALEVARGAQLPSDAGSLLGFGTAAVFAIAGATEGGARFLPALIGAFAPLTMLWARPLIGRGPAAIAAVLLTLSPLLLDQARAVHSGAIAATICLALGWAVFDYARTRRPGRLYASAVLLALALTAGLGAVSALLALLIVAILGLVELSRRQRLPEDVDAALVALAPANGHGQGAVPATELAAPTGRDAVSRAAGLFAGTLLIVATGGLTNLGGVGDGLFGPIGSWLTAPAAPDALPRWAGVLTLVAYEPFALVLGIVGAVWASRNSRALDRYLLLWAGLGVLAALFAPDRSADLLAGAIAPATVLAAVVVHRLLLRVLDEAVVDYLVSLLVLAWGFSLVLLGFGHLSQPDPIGVRYVAPVLAAVVGRASSESAARSLIAVLPVVLLVGGVVYSIRRTQPGRRGSVAAAAATVLLALSVHAGWNLAYNVTGNPGEMVRNPQTTVDVRALAEDVDGVRQVLTINRKDKTLVIDASERYPLGWYLRDRDTRMEPNPGATAAMIVLPVDAKAPAGRYAGQRYRIGTAADVQFENTAQLWRWLVYRESPHLSAGEDVVLYVRAQ